MYASSDVITFLYFFLELLCILVKIIQSAHLHLFDNYEGVLTE